MKYKKPFTFYFLCKTDLRPNINGRKLSWDINSATKRLYHSTTTTTMQCDSDRPQVGEGEAVVVIAPWIDENRWWLAYFLYLYVIMLCIAWKKSGHSIAKAPTPVGTKCFCELAYGHTPEILLQFGHSTNLDVISNSVEVHKVVTLYFLPY